MIEPSPSSVTPSGLTSSPFPPYAELHAHSYFSFLDGASSPEALVIEAKRLGLSAVALTDTNSLAGAVRFWQAAKEEQVHPIFGAVVTLADATQLTLLAETNAGYGNLCQLISASRLDAALQPIYNQPLGNHQLDEPHEGQSHPMPMNIETPWMGKVDPQLSWARLTEFSQGIICLTGGRKGAIDQHLLQHEHREAADFLSRLCNIFDEDHLFVELHQNYLPHTSWLHQQLAALAAKHQRRLVATGNVYYAHTAHARLRDCFRAIAQNMSLGEARRGGHVPLNHSFGLCGPEEIQQRFAASPSAIATSVEIAKRCRVSLDFSQQRFPAYRLEKGGNEFSELYERCHVQLPHRYPDLNPKVLSRLSDELRVIEEAHLGGFFLHVAHIMAEARCRKIRGQGRGSAGNSIVTYLLGITPIDPIAHGLLFERFLSADRYSTPDIDIDFDTNRRDELIAFIYEYFGHDHVAMVANHITYKAKSAIRDLGKALGIPPAELTRFSKGLDTHSPTQAAAQLMERLPDDAPAEHPLRLLCDLLPQIDGAPRHLGIHNGGMLITAQPITTVVPVEMATMPGRFVVQWDKNGVEDCGLIKLDILGLRALNVITDALAEIESSGKKVPDFEDLPLDDSQIYQMIHRADTIGASQVESRAQMGFGPRLKPVKFTELMMQVAIVRPGPIQAGSVNPLLRRRGGKEPVAYSHECLEDVLHDTYGVLLYQEQAIKVAMVAAGFTAGEADVLRRALSREDEGTIYGRLQRRFVAGAAAKGIEEEQAKEIYLQLAGFSGYGFCKSHAGSLALVAYQNLWLKKYHPGAFYAAIMNNQPMGFYSNEVIINDAKRHGVEILPPDIGVSEFRHTLHQPAKGKDQIRTGLRSIKGVGTQAWERIEAARTRHEFTGLKDLATRTKLSHDILENLIVGGALDLWGERRQLLWQLKQLDLRDDTLGVATLEKEIPLPTLAALEKVVWEYELVGFSATTQIMSLYREQLRTCKILSSWEAKAKLPGKKVLVAGMSIVVQRPGTANGMTFQTIEDEFGTVDLVIKPNLYPKLRDVIRGERLIVAQGIVQREAGAVNVVVGWMWGLGRVVS